jgi:murein DD-endopeptidase MepM/ murein hydrolase activator NlpD
VRINTRQKLLFGSIGLIILAMTIPTAYYQYAASTVSIPIEEEIEGTSIFEETIPYKVPNIKYGFVLNDYRVKEGVFKKNQFLSEVLTKEHVPYSSIDQVVNKSKDIFDVRKMRVGKEYTILGPKDETKAAQYIVYEPSPFRYIVYDLQGKTKVTEIERSIDTVQYESSGIIYSSLWSAMMDNDLDYELAVKMEDALAYNVDFHHLSADDKFKLVYERLYIEGEPVGIGQLKAAHFQQSGRDHYAYYYQDDAYKGYFSEEGRPMKKAFLKAPVKYSRISSPFNLRRFHPVLRRVKAHLGTDYAAPKGTPIYAVANGVVTRSGYGRGNGNFVKIKHDKVYATQYLHMSKISKLGKKGTKVMQGDIIGYVGSTGLATGPHVCYRFWKNGKQINPKDENLPAPEPMTEEHLVQFKASTAELRKQLNAITYKSKEELASLKVKKKETDSKTIP